MKWFSLLDCDEKRGHLQKKLNLWFDTLFVVHCVICLLGLFEADKEIFKPEIILDLEIFAINKFLLMMLGDEH